MTATTQVPRFVLGASNKLDGSLIIPDTVNMPPAVEEANDVARLAIEDFRLTSYQLRTAQAGVGQAKAADAAADRAAIAGGTALPGDRQKAAPKAVEALAVARRRWEAARGLAKDANVLLARAISSEHGAWMPAAERAAEQLEAEALAALDQLVEVADRLAAQRSVVAALGKWPVGGGALTVTTLAPMPAEHVERLRDEALARLDRADQQTGQRDQVARDLPSLVAAVRRAITGPKERVVLTRS